MLLHVLCVFCVAPGSQAFCYDDLQWFHLFVKNMMFLECGSEVKGVNKCTVPNHEMNLDVSAEIKGNVPQCHRQLEISVAGRNVLVFVS